MGKGMRAGKRPTQKNAGGAAKMAQLQAMQAKMESAREEIEAKETEGSAGGGAVNVKVNGKHRVTEVRIKPEACDPEDVEMLEDLIMAAANEALRGIDEISQSEMEKIAGIGLPAGLF